MYPTRPAQPLYWPYAKCPQQSPIKGFTISSILQVTRVRLSLLALASCPHSQA